MTLRALKRLALSAALLAGLLGALPAAAVTLLRDAEMERALRELARPVIAAAGLSAGRINIIVIDDDRLNAFVMDTTAVYIHSGLLLKMKRPEMLQAVIAHEIAHIGNGHITRRAGNARAARNTALLGMLAAGVAGAANPQLGAAVGLGTSAAAQGAFLGHTRAEESAADQSAVRFLARTGIDPQALVEVMEIFEGQEVLSAARQDPYLRTHPLSRDRLRAIRGYAAAYREGNATDAQAAYWYARVQAKLSAYARAPRWTLRKYGKGDTSDAALVGRAYAYHRQADTKRALAEIDTLIARRPTDAYAHELRGQILLESRNFRAAVTAYRRAADLAPREPLIQAGHGSALLAAGDYGAALRVLEAARARDRQNPRLLRDLAVAYARQGRNAEASLATAERYALTGRLDTAAIHAKRAAGLLPRGSAAWQRAMDIADTADQIAKRKR
jgi:predicted Zn-dependent protease